MFCAHYNNEWNLDSPLHNEIEITKQWTEAGSSAPKKAKSAPSAEKVIASFLGH